MGMGSCGLRPLPGLPRASRWNQGYKKACSPANPDLRPVWPWAVGAECPQACCTQKSPFSGDPQALPYLACHFSRETPHPQTALNC